MNALGAPVCKFFLARVLFLVFTDRLYDNLTQIRT